MFTGIIEERGELVELLHLEDAARLTICGRRVTEDAVTGDSIAVNGVCLTADEVIGGIFTADVMRETLVRSTLGELRPGDEVNLERAATVNSRLGGHIVQGHVDGTAVLQSRTIGENWDVLRFSLPATVGRYVVEKGSIAVNGVSLTVSAVADGPDPDTDGWFEVSLIPTTLERTTLGRLGVGDAVNLEVDVIAKYVERLLTGASPEARHSELRRVGALLTGGRRDQASQAGAQTSEVVR